MGKKETRGKCAICGKKLKGNYGYEISVCLEQNGEVFKKVFNFASICETCFSILSAHRIDDWCPMWHFINDASEIWKKIAREKVEEWKKRYI